MKAVVIGAGLLISVLLIGLLGLSAAIGTLVTPAVAAPIPAGAAAAPFTGDSTGCTAEDPTGGRCLTPATRHAYDQIIATFGEPGTGPIRSAGCFDEHAWNPRSDHSRGRGCDFFPRRFGEFPTGTDLDKGWQLAHWLRANAEPLQVSYVIWQGRFWSPATPDRDGGWGRPYTGGGIYDPTDATGGHFDHVHLSIK